MTHSPQSPTLSNNFVLIYGLRTYGASRGAGVSEHVDRLGPGGGLGGGRSALLSAKVLLVHVERVVLLDTVLHQLHRQRAGGGGGGGVMFGDNDTGKRDISCQQGTIGCQTPKIKFEDSMPKQHTIRFCN